jgi:hypothetical protein
VVVVVEVVVVDVVAVVLVVGAAVVTTGGNVVIAAVVVVASLSLLQAAAISARHASKAAVLIDLTAGVYTWCLIELPLRERLAGCSEPGLGRCWPGRAARCAIVGRLWLACGYGSC